jgi:DNA replication protein DnaC
MGSLRLFFGFFPLFYKVPEIALKLRYERYFAYSTLGNRFVNKTFENFGVSEDTSKALKESKRFVHSVMNTTTDEEQARGVILTGPVGTGKSHLAAAVFNKLKGSKACIFVSVPELLARIMASYNPKSNESEDDIINAVKQCDVLILDDLGAERHKDDDDYWATEKLFTIIDSIGIGLGISIIIIMASLVAWRFSRPWRDKRATEKGHQKVMREIWRLRSHIADGAFDEQGLDILNALAYVEDSLITFKVYKTEATQAEQINLLKEVKPKLNEIITRFGNAWKDTTIDNALKNISMFSK